MSNTRKQFGSDNPCWRGDRITYAAMHYRIEAARGKASLYPCAADCGKQANEWAYDGHDHDGERSDTHGLHAGRAYSLLTEHYRPLCRGCHRSFDRTLTSRLRRATVMALRATGMSGNKIAAKLGCSTDAVYRDIRKSRD